MYVITGATGHTGRIAAETLLAAGRQVRAVVRDAAKGAALKAKGAEIFVADLTDQVALAEAVRGAHGVFFISPPDMVAQDFIGDRKRLTQQQVSTFAAEKVPHVVLLSSIGAQHPSGTGPIVSLHNAEQQLRASGVAATFVRAGYFVENWGSVLPAAKNDGVLPAFLAADVAVPMVGTFDIGRTIATALLEGPRGVRVIELGGPLDASPVDVAVALSKILGKPVQVVPVPLEAVVPTFTSFGISENMAGLYHEMYRALADGKVKPESSERVRGSTALEATLRTLLG